MAIRCLIRMAVALVSGQEETAHSLGQPCFALLANHQDGGSKLVCGGAANSHEHRRRSEASETKTALHIFAARSLSELPTTDTDEALIAKAANIGLMRIPKKGNRTPAAIGTPAAL